MLSNKVSLMLLLGAGVVLSGCSRQVSYQEEVLPILRTSCFSCHVAGEGAQNAGLILNSYSSMMAGTKMGPVVVPGSAASSTLYLVISHNVDPKIQMPPHHDDKMAQGQGEPLSMEQIDTIKLWIDQGAKNN
ncbi:c-type cytochrome domain-containing protein [Shewanella sedimentimangrovi]|uniref:Cytochrome c domain-containing protein n=1 Tax=Shewanella sedimentimangrovi TaxID=2814293 RepID=A0ABX7R446_9GAMM|nr:c-type cytochrome domain-containing protein [Shewanella sedimentimangrovi]QSX37960.1 hypothetical protein JYB85_03720 [Shewanella sedimentimangrovi]